MNYEKGIFKMRQKTAFILLLSSFICLAQAPAAQRELIENRKVEAGQSKKESHKFFQAESVQLTGTYTQNGRPVDLSGTNTVVVWEIQGWIDYTNTYAISTGVVSSVSNQVTFSLTPAACNLPPATYLGFVRALQSVSNQLVQVAVLAYQTIAVEWSPDSRNYSLVAPLTYPPLYTEADWQEITNQVASVEGRVASVEARTNVWNSVTNKADQSDLSAVSDRAGALEARTNVWNTAYSWGDHAGLYLGLSAWGTASNDLWQAIGNRLETSVFTGWTNTQHAVNTNYAARITELENRPVSDTNLAAIVTQATNDIAELNGIIGPLTNDLQTLETTVSSHQSAITNLQSAVVYRTDLDGGWYYPDWFQWSFSQVADGVPDLTTISTNNDVILQTSVYSALGGSWNITYSGVRAADFSAPAVTSASQSVATCTVGKVWYVSTGTATVSAAVGDFARTTNLTMELVSSLTNEVVIGCVTGSAVCAFAAGIDSRLTDGTDKAVYSTQDHTATNYVRNASSWVADIDLTCVSPWNSTGGRTRAGTLIGSDCIIFANHFPLSVGATVRFVTSSNTVIERTVSARQQVLQTDFMLGRLSAAISTNDCRPCLIEPYNYGDYMTETRLGYNNLRPVLWVDQYENAYVADSPVYGSISLSTDATRMLYNKTPIINDSGSPAFYIADGQPPVLMTTMYSTLGGFSVGLYAKSIIATAAALGCDTNTIYEADYGAMGFTSYLSTPPSMGE